MLQLFPGVGERQEPVRVETLGPQPAIERFDKGVIGRLAWPAEVERNLVLVRPQI